MDAPILRIIQQRHEMDCAVACLAMAAGVSYENALVAIARDEPDVCVKGVYLRHLKAAAKRLGFSLTSHRKYDLDTDNGILNVEAPLWKSSHLVVLKSGLIVETDATIWDADVFAAQQGMKLGRLYVLEAA